MKTYLKQNSIALIGLALALLSLYLTQIREPDVSVHLGQEIFVYHPGAGNLRLLAPVSFINNASRIGTVFRIAVLLTRDSIPSQTYIMNWQSFQMLEGSWKKESDAAMVAVPPNSSVSKTIQFHWEGKDDLSISSGAYTLRLAIWDAATRKPSSNQKYNFVVSEETAKEIRSKRVPKNNKTTEIQVYSTVSDSIVMSREEVSALLGI